MAVNSGSSATAEAAGRRVPAARRGHRRMALAIAAAGAWLGLGIIALVTVGGLVIQGVALGAVLVPRAVVWLFLAAQSGADWWSIAGRAATGLATALSSSQVMWWLIGLELLGIAGLVGLQKMLREELHGRDSEEDKK
jgi:hypothetical protein